MREKATYKNGRRYWPPEQIVAARAWRRQHKRRITTIAAYEDLPVKLCYAAASGYVSGVRGGNAARAVAAVGLPLAQNAPRASAGAQGGDKAKMDT